MKARVLVDGTVCLDTSGARGIGRLLRDLLHGLAEIRAERDDLAFEALVDLSPLGRPRITADLRAAADDLHARRGTLEDRIAPRRQRFLPWVARRHDVVHLLEPRGVPWLSPTPIVVTLHDLVPLRFPRDYLGRSPLAAPVRRLREALRVRRVAQPVAISERTRRDLEALLGLPRERVSLVPNGIDLSRWSATPLPDDEARCRRLGVTRPFALYVGYCDPRKNVPFLIEALARAEAALDLVWVGQLNPEDVARFAPHFARLPGRVRLLGFVDDGDLSALYRRAAVHPLLSRLEGFGLSVVEALSSGCPVLVARDSGADEIAGDAAEALDPDDVEAAARALTRVVTLPPDERAALVARGLARAQRFGRLTMARAYADVFQRVAARRARFVIGQRA